MEGFSTNLKVDPIGLRGTCAVARIVMQMFDSRWKEILRNNKIRTWEIMR